MAHTLPCEDPDSKLKGIPNYFLGNIQTDEIILYSSMHKAAKSFKQQSRLLSAYDGKCGGIDTLLMH